MDELLANMTTASRLADDVAREENVSVSVFAGALTESFSQSVKSAMQGGLLTQDVAHAILLATAVGTKVLIDLYKQDAAQTWAD